MRRGNTFNGLKELAHVAGRDVSSPTVQDALQLAASTLDGIDTPLSKSDRYEKWLAEMNPELDEGRAGLVVAHMMFLSRDYPGAIAYLDSTRMKLLSSRLQDSGKLLKGIALARINKREQAIETLQELVDTDSASTVSAQAMFQIGLLHLMGGNQRAGLTSLKELLEKHPRNTHAEKARDLILRFKK